MHNSKNCIIVILLATLFIMCTQSYATQPYAFSVENFSLIGVNGFEYFVDEFDDNIIDPWSIMAGTAYELDGLLTLRDPGSSYSVQIENFIYAGEESTVTLSNQDIGAVDGGGNFTLTSIWTFETCIPDLDQGYHMEAHIHNNPQTLHDEIMIRVHNVGPNLGYVLNIDPGLVVIFENFISGENGWETDRQIFPIDEADISGDIRLSLHFDDFENTLTAAFSLDGGNTYQYPFTPTTVIDQGDFDAWRINAESIEVQLISEPATVDVHPDTLNLKSKGNWITCYIELPQDYSPSEIDIGTLVLIIGNDIIAPEISPTEIGDYDGNGTPDLMVKFDRQSVQDVCVVGPLDMSVRFETYSGILFSGEDSVLVIDKGKNHESEDQGSVVY